jgi:NAD(P)H-nitrite reductase large subunit
MHIVIIGSGVGGVSFAEKYRSLQAETRITLITREDDGYYSRPLLSRGFSTENIEQSIIMKPFDKLRAENIELISGAEVTGINRADRTVSVSGPDRQRVLPYDTLVLAQGSEAFIPPPFRPDSDLFFRLNNLVDLKKLRRFRQGFLDRHLRPAWGIIGGGLIGCEVASDLAVSGDPVTLYHAADRLMERQLVPEDSVTLLNVMQGSGVEVLLSQSVQGFSKQGDKVCVEAGVSAPFDAVLVATGFKPRTELAEQAGLEVGRGIKVNQRLQTSDDHIYALGDVAELPNGKLYAFILPIRNQALWLAGFLAGQENKDWQPPTFNPKAKVHGFQAAHPYLF